MKKFFATFLCLVFLLLAGPAAAENIVHKSADYGFSFEATGDYGRFILAEKGITPKDGMFFATYVLAPSKPKLPPIVIRVSYGNFFLDKSITFDSLFHDRKMQKKYINELQTASPELKAKITGEKTAGKNRFLVTHFKGKELDFFNYAAAKKDELIDITYRNLKNLTPSESKILEENIELVLKTITWPDSLSTQTEIKQNSEKKRVDYKLDNIGLAFSSTEAFPQANALKISTTFPAFICMLYSEKRLYPPVDIWCSSAPKKQADVSYSKDKYADDFEKEVKRPDALTNIKYSRLFARKAVVTPNYKFIVTILEVDGKKDFSAKTIENGKTYTIHTNAPMNKPEQHRAVEENFYLVLETFKIL